jgi:hypothetical protein
MLVTSGPERKVARTSPDKLGLTASGAARSLRPARWPTTPAAASHPVPVAELVRVAASRWAVEETFQFATNETGLDHCQVRRFDAWYSDLTMTSWPRADKDRGIASDPVVPAFQLKSAILLRTSVCVRVPVRSSGCGQMFLLVS